MMVTMTTTIMKSAEGTGNETEKTPEGTKKENDRYNAHFDLTTEPKMRNQNVLKLWTPSEGLSDKKCECNAAVPCSSMMSF
jgi:hypothetical protein